jgi:hypothetical protein
MAASSGPSLGSRHAAGMRHVRPSMGGRAQARASKGPYAPEMIRALAGALLLAAAAAAPAAEVTAPDATVKLDVYGTILANSYLNSTGMFGSDVPLWAVSPSDPRAADDEFGITARQSRLGLRLRTPDLGSAKVSGVLEMDFFGSFPNGGQRASFAQARLRHANVRLEWKQGSFLAGQDWVVLAPLNPTTLSHFAVVGFAASGNLWLRYPQLRGEVWQSVGSGRLGLTAALVRPVAGSDPDAPGAFVDAAGAGERSGTPFVQGRLFYTRPVQARTLGLGLSGHYGQESHRLGTGASVSDHDADSWGVAGDLQLPIGKVLLLQGEAWTGENLDSFQGGINQGVLVHGSEVAPLSASGGWAQLSLTPPSVKTVSLHLGAGIDDLDEEDLAPGMRARNRSFMGSVIWKPTAQWQAAFEYGHVSTNYAGLGENSGSVVNVAFGLTF